MYKLYWGPGLAAMAPQAVLEEIGVPYEPIRLDVQKREHEQAEYKRLNPNGRIPTLVDGDFTIFETAAICQYLADRHPEAGLVPAEMAAHHILLARMLVVLRLVAPDGGEPAPASRALVARACGTESWEELLAAHDAARQKVHQVWRSIAESR